MDRIKEDTRYVLLPEHDDMYTPKPRGMFGKDIIETFGADAAQTALDKGTPLTFKGNKYYLDEAL